jgi:hypothetical protein
MRHTRHLIGCDRFGTIQSEVPLVDSRLHEASEVITVPVGVRHAVATGAVIALCGHEPRYILEGTTFPGFGSIDDLCPECLDALVAI